MGKWSRLERIRDWEAEARKANYHACDLAKMCAVSDRQLRRYLLRQFGMPPQEWMDRLRLRESHALLRAGNSVKEVAFKLGYKRPSRFCEAFKREYGRCATSSFAH